MQRVLRTALGFEMRLHDLGGYHFQLFHFGRGKWKVVPLVDWRELILLDYHEALHHMAGSGLYEAVRKDYWWPSLHVDCITFAEQCPGCGLERTHFN